MLITAIDFETANYSPASVCAVGVSCMEDGELTDEYYTLIRPADNVSRFDPGNIRIHGIHPEDVEDAPGFHETYDKLLPLLSDSLVCAHNARFDMGCLKAACRNVGLPLPRFSWFDTVALSRKLYPSLPHHRLNDMCDYLDVDLNHHNAASDAYGCLMIVVHAMEDTGIYDIEELLHQTGIPIYPLR